MYRVVGWCGLKHQAKIHPRTQQLIELVLLISVLWFQNTEEEEEEEFGGGGG